MMKLRTKNRRWQRALVAGGLLITSLTAAAQTAEWYLPAGRRVLFNGGDFGAPTAATHAYGSLGATCYLRPDGTPWFYLTLGTSAQVRLVNANGSTTLVGTLPAPASDYFNPAGTDPHVTTTTTTQEVAAVVPVPGVAGRFTLVYGATADDDGTGLSNGPHPRNSFVVSTTLDFDAAGQATLGTSATRLDDTQTIDATLRAAVSGPDAAGNFALAVLAFGGGDSTAAAAPSSAIVPYRSKLAVYQVNAVGAVSRRAVVKANVEGVAQEAFENGQLALARDGQHIGWTVSSFYANTALPDLVYVDLTRAAPNRTRTYTFSAANLTRSVGIPALGGLAFNPYTNTAVFVSGGAVNGSRPYDGLTSLNFAQAFSTGYPSLRYGGSATRSSARDRLFVGFDRNLYGAANPTATTGRLTAFAYNAGGLVSAAPQVTNLAFALPSPLPVGVDGWHANYLKVINGPVAAQAPAGGTVSVTHQGPLTQGAGLTPNYAFRNGSGSYSQTTRDFTAGYAAQPAPYPIDVVTTLVYCGQTYSVTSPTRYLTVTTADPAPSSTSYQSLVAVPTRANSSFRVERANAADTAVTQPIPVSILDAYGQSVYHNDAYQVGQAVDVTGWVPGLYQVLLPASVPGHRRVRVLVQP